MENLAVISEENLIKALTMKDEWIVVDARRTEAFNGWDLEHKGIHGHIIGATDFSEHWLSDYLGDNDQRLQALMRYKGINSNVNIVLYDTNGKDAKKVSEFFKKYGCEKLYYFDLANWKGELRSYPNYHKIVPVEWVKDVIDGKKTEKFNGGKYRIFEVSWKEAPQEFIKNHIPGSIHINSDEFECLPAWTHRSKEELEEFLINNDIDNETTVILYGCDLNSASDYKLAVILGYMGISDVRIMSGGLPTWIDAGYPNESGNPSKVKSKQDNIICKYQEKNIITIEDAKEILKGNKEGQLVDTRGWSSFNGTETGYDYCDTAGRIPGSYWFEDVNFSNVDGTMRNFFEVESLLSNRNIDINRDISFYCGSAAWDGSIIKVYAEVAGYNNASIFEGGWFEWQLDKNNPYETGIPQGYTVTGRRKISSFTNQYYKLLGLNCAETIAHSANDALDLNIPATSFIGMGGFGGGMGVKGLCGAVSGGIFALGFLYTVKSGHESPLLMDKVKLFIGLVNEEFKSDQCSILRKCGLRDDDRCLNIINKISDILDEVIDKEISTPLFQTKDVSTQLLK